jgi:hypothetical protein
MKNAKGFAGDLVGSFLKDVSKNLVKSYFDTQEQEAWTAFFSADVQTYPLLAMWNMASNKYWELRDDYDALLDRKAQLGRGQIPDLRTKVKQDDKFPDKQLLDVVLQVTHGGPLPLDFEVTVGGRAASRKSGFTYEVSSNGFRPSDAGLGLTLVAR